MAGLTAGGFGFPAASAIRPAMHSSRSNFPKSEIWLCSRRWIAARLSRFRPATRAPALALGRHQLQEGAYAKSVEKIPDCRGERSGRRHRVSAGCNSCEGRRGDGGKNQRRQRLRAQKVTARRISMRLKATREKKRVAGRPNNVRHDRHEEPRSRRSGLPPVADIAEVRGADRAMSPAGQSRH